MRQVRPFTRGHDGMTRHVGGPTIAEQIAQGAKCGCKGSDDMCPCQNVVFAPKDADAAADDAAVDRFAVAMKDKLAQKRAQGYGGWQYPSVCSVEALVEMLAAHVAKGDPVDVGNFAMMIWNRLKAQR